MSTVRKYTLSLEVEVHAQDDFEHFRPESVVASIPALGISWVSSNDAEALRDFFAFFIRGDHIQDWTVFFAGGREIIARALTAADEEAAE
jgi:hypothetical protein